MNMQGYYCDDPSQMFSNDNNDPNFNEWVLYDSAHKLQDKNEKLQAKNKKLKEGNELLLSFHQLCPHCQKHIKGGECLGCRVSNLQAELEKHRWIPVTERLPENVDDIELMYPDGLIIKGYYSRSSFYPNYDIDIEHDSVTHWKPIISLKEQDEKS